MKPFFVYMLRCADGTYYVGHTDELERRVALHQAGEVPGYTQQRRPLELVWVQESSTRDEALSFERRVKGWSRAKKEALIAGDWKRVQRLAWGTRNPLPEHLRDDGAGASIPQPERSSEQPERSRTQAQRGVGQAKRGAEQAERGVEQAERGVGQAERGGGQAKRGGGQVERGVEQAQIAVRPEVSKDSAQLQSILAKDRRAIAKAITLIESTRADHREQADALLTTLLPHTGKALRLGISGVPGVGKSTFIEAFGLHLIAQGHRVAVLTIDPSSSLSGGSILGDKTRMEKLSTHEAAYIRPSPSSGTLGGVAEKTREAMLVLEAAGYSVVIVETVGVGQSETSVADMTDLFVLMQLPNAGDDLQAIKRGVMELADLVLINKADIDPKAATRAEAQISGALKFFGQHAHTRVLKISALQSQGIDAFWAQVQGFVQRRRESGEFDARRSKQGLAWMWNAVHAGLQSEFRNHAEVQKALPQVVDDVVHARIDPFTAARRLLALFERPKQNRSP